MKRRSDIDGTRIAIRPRISGSSAGTVGPHVHTTIPVHTHSADTITFEPAGALAGDDVQEVAEELDAEKLARDGTQTMLGDLPMDHHSIADADDVDVEGTATVGENVTLTGAVGVAILGGVRQVQLTGADTDGEGLLTGIECIEFNGTPPASLMTQPTAIQFNANVIPGTDTTPTVGQFGWSYPEGMPQADVVVTGGVVRSTLGWTVLRWLNASPAWVVKFKSVYLDGIYLREFDNAASWPAANYLPPFGLTMHEMSGESDHEQWVMVDGILRDVDTSAWAVGAVLYGDGAGGIDDAPPAYVAAGTLQAPVVVVGTVRESHATTGIVEVCVRAYPPHEILPGRSIAAAHPATAITNAPAGSLEATTVQAAIDELEAQKVGRRWSYMTKGF